MKEELFAELLESMREGGTILRGEKPASRKIVICSTNKQKNLPKHPILQDASLTLLDNFLPRDKER